MTVSRRHRSIRAAFGITVGLLTWVSIASYWTTHAQQSAFASATRTHQALDKFLHLEVLLESASSSVSAYVVSGEGDRLNGFQYAKLMVPSLLQEIEILAPIRPEKQAVWKALNEQIKVRLQRLGRVVEARRVEGLGAGARAIQAESGADRDHLERLLSDVQEDYLTALKTRSARTTTRTLQTKALLALAMLFSLVLVGWSYLLLKKEALGRDLAETEKGQTEALFQTVIERMPYMVLLKDAQHLRVRLANQTACQWLQQDRRDVEGAVDTDLRDAAEAAATTELERDALRLGRAIDAQEKLTVADRPDRVLHTQKIPLLNDDGVAVYILSISEDITEQKQAERMLELSRDAALEAVRLRSEFIRNMSHELRTPLSIVIGMASLLQDTTLAPEQKKFVDTIRRSAEGLSGLTKNILDFSRIEAGSFSIENREINVLQVTDSVAAMLVDQAKAKGVALVTLASPEVPILLRGDASRISQILTQLVSNAVKFTEKGQISVRVTVLQNTESQVRVQWQITDTGIGIAEEVQKHIFEPFRQGDGSWTRKYGGTGLGLAMTRRIVELLGGEMEFESALGMGSTFRFSLPLTKRHVRGPEVQIHSLPWSRAHVLVVSENEVTRQSVRQQLNDCALSCEVVSSGQAAVEALRRGPQNARAVSLVLVDMHLPDMDAVHLAKIVRQDKALRGTKLALMWTDKSSLDENTMGTLGFVGALKVPCQAQEFYSQLAKWMDPGEPSRKRQVA